MVLVATKRLNITLGDLEAGFASQHNVDALQSAMPHCKSSDKTLEIGGSCTIDAQNEVFLCETLF